MSHFAKMMKLLGLFTLAVGGFCSRANAQEDAVAFKPGDRVEVAQGFDWKAGTVVAISNRSGLVEVRFDDDGDLPEQIPADVRERMRTRSYPSSRVRLIKAASTTKAVKSSASRTWSDRSGKFRVTAQLDRITEGGVVLVKPDGKRVEVPLEKLSEEDQQYVRDLKEPMGNPFEAPSTKATASNWQELSVVRPQSFSSWTFIPRVIDPHPAPNSASQATVGVQLGEIPNSERFFEAVSGIYPAEDGSRALVCRKQGKVRQDRQEFIELIDLGKSDSGGLIPLPENTAILDALPAAGLVMYRPDLFGFGKKMLLTIARIDGKDLKPFVQWEPYVHEEWEPNRDIDQAWFLGPDRVMTINHQGKALTVWEVAAAKALFSIPVRSSINLKSSLSRDRKLLSIVLNDEIAIIDLDAGRHVATLPTGEERILSVKLRDDNRRLAALSDQGITLWDLETGNKLHVVFHSILDSAREVEWCGEFLMVGNRHLFDVDRRVLLWEYRSATGSTTDAKLSGGRLWVVTNEPERPSTLVSVAVPHAEAVSQAKKLPTFEEMLVVKPGAEIAIEIDIDPNIASGEEVRRSLKTALESAGYRVVEGAQLVVRAVCKRQEQQTIRINVDGRFPVRDEDIVERTITPCASYLEMTLAGELLWKKGYIARPGMIIFVKQDETLDQALERLTTPNTTLFASATFPSSVARPGKASTNGAYGISQVTEQGLVQGPQSSGDVFE